MVTIRDMLQSANDRLLIGMTSRHGVPGKALTRKEMIAGLEARLNDEAYLAGCLRRLPPEQVHLLRYAIMFRPWAYRVRKHSLPHAEALRDLGFVKGNEVPAEVERAVVRTWTAELTVEGAEIPARGPDPTGPGAMRDLIAILGMASRRALPLTQKGELFKKTEDAWLDCAEDAAQLRPGTMPLSVMGYAQRRGLIMPVEYAGTSKPGFALTPAGSTWASQSWGAIWTDLALCFMDGGVSFFEGRRAAVLVLANSPAGTWLSVQAWAEGLQQVVDLREDYHGLYQYVQLLAGMDLVEVLAFSEKDLRVRVTPALRAILAGREPQLPEPEPWFYVQPTFEIVAPKTLPAAVQYQLERLTGSRKADGTLQYKLSFAGLRPALEDGETAESIIGFLERHSRAPLPQNVRVELCDWAGRGMGARFETVTLLRLNSAEAAAKVMSDRLVRELVLSAVTPTDLVVDAASVERVRKRLGDLGLITAPGVAAPGQPAPERSRYGYRPPAPAPPEPPRLLERWFGGPLAPPPVAPAVPARGLAVRTPTSGPPAKRRAPANQAECAALLRGYASAHTEVILLYQGDEATREFTIQPLRVLDDRLLAFCPETGAERKFKLGRIKAVEPTGETF